LNLISLNSGTVLHSKDADLELRDDSDNLILKNLNYNLTQSGYVICNNLNSDIIDTPSKCCINITANNVTFDGNEHIINSNGGSNDINPELGICVFRDSATNTSISLFDFNASDFYRGIHLNNSNAISINNVNFYEGDNPPTAWIGIFCRQPIIEFKFNKYQF